ANPGQALEFEGIEVRFSRPGGVAPQPQARAGGRLVRADLDVAELPQRDVGELRLRHVAATGWKRGCNGADQNRAARLFSGRSSIPSRRGADGIHTMPGTGGPPSFPS